MRKITHPHIVALLDILESTNHIHLVMEFCQLGDLATFVKKKDKLAGHPVTADMLRRYPNLPGWGFHEVIVRHFAKQLASALEFLRSKNLVHRDLKPQNLLLNPPRAWIEQESPENRPFAVSKTSLTPATGLESLPFLKIADFGFARHLPTTTMAETLCGSPLYMAPEILRYEKYDAKADLWSVGSVLYELMLGRPPFRAANHVELLRRIEKAMDKIKLPDDVSISDDMKVVIRGLLKKTPTERMSWEAFFQSAIITNDIPNLDVSDMPIKNSEADRRPTKDNLEKFASTPSSEHRLTAPRRNSRRASDERLSVDQTRFSTPPESTITTPRRSSINQNRPSLPDRATAPSAVPGVRNDRISQTTQKSAQPASGSMTPSASAPRSSSERDRAPQPRQADRASREARERAAQDVAFERDYVMVEKRAVEVNAFADELANNPAVQAGARHSPSSSPAMMPRRATTQAVSSVGTRQPTQTTRNMQTALMPEAAHQRRASYDRRFAPSRGSAQSALAAALNMVNLRFPNNPFNPSSGKPASSPQGYGPFPAFPSQPSPSLPLSDSPKEKTPVDEDHRILSTMEDSATRSDVVYGFAEVKYKQLIPIAPSNEGTLQGRDEANEDEDGLTPDAIIGISEEAIVLYLKALAILTNTINLAGSWWSQKARSRETTSSDNAASNSPKSAPEAAGTDSSSGKPPAFAAVSARINGVVQWSRNRFNECLEKSEFVSRKMLEAQAKQRANRSSASSSPSKHAEEQEFKSTGVTAEKLMYERALDMSRAAAVNELTGTDLSGCEVSYLTAVRLLEAVLEKHSDDVFEGRKAERKKPKEREEPADTKGEDCRDKIAEDEVSAEDKETIFNCECLDFSHHRVAALMKIVIEQMHHRIIDLRKKLGGQKAARSKDKQPLPPQQTPASTSPRQNLEAPRMAKASSSPSTANKPPGSGSPHS